MATSLLGLFLPSFFSDSYFVFKVTSLCFLFMTILNTQATFFHAIIFKTNLKTVERLKNVQIRNFERNTFS